MELKENAVQCYLTTDLTYEAVARKFEITNFTLLASWVNHFKIYGEVPISKKRGRRKKLESMASSMTQKPNDSQRIKELEQELRYVQIEVAYLKGLRRLEKNALMNKNQDSSTVLRKTFKLKEILKVTGFPKATYYYWVNCFERVNKDELIEKEMLKIRQEHANAGYRPMSEFT